MDGIHIQDSLDGESGQIQELKNHPKANSPRVKIWTPARFLSNKPRDAQPENPYAVIILNQPIDKKELLVDVCRGAIYKACADGGANRLKDLALKGEAEILCRPNIICGDLDSLLPEVGAHYQALGTQILQDSDQNSTDLTKCLHHIRGLAFHPAPGSNPSTQPPLDVAIIGSLSGRADQAFSQIHHLYAASQNPALATGDLYLLTGESIVFVLHRGTNLIRTPLGPALLAQNVGIIPIGRPAVISTRGLEWDVEEWRTEVGVRVSTSNHVRGEVVEVETSERVLFMVEVAGRMGE